MAHEFDGKKYEKVSAHQREWGAKLISELSLNGNEHVLELDLDEGVKVNYAKFQGVEVPRDNGRIVRMDLLAKI